MEPTDPRNDRCSPIHKQLPIPGLDRNSSNYWRIRWAITKYIVFLAGLQGRERERVCNRGIRESNPPFPPFNDFPTFDEYIYIYIYSRVEIIFPSFKTLH